MLRAYAQLLRIPNVFTAMADVCLGWLVIRGSEYRNTSLETLFWLLGASSCLYCAGMIFNDVFDVEEDRKERPFRPIPSGRISRLNAAILGSLLLGTGIVCAWGASDEVLRSKPLIIAGSLAVCILLYDAGVKRTVVGPIVMGVCRYLNVLLGLSSDFSWWLDADELGAYVIAPVVALYIVGVTLFAETEAVQSRRPILIRAAVVMLFAFFLAELGPLMYRGAEAEALLIWIFLVAFASLAIFVKGDINRLDPKVAPSTAGSLSVYWLPPITIALFFMLVGLLPAFARIRELLPEREAAYYPLLGLMWFVIIAVPVLGAIRRPEPGRVQFAVKTCILGVIGLDAVLAFAIVGWPGLLILGLLLPAIILGRWIYST